MSKATIKALIDAKQKRLALILDEERQLVQELHALWKEYSEITSGVLPASVESQKS